MRVCLFPQVSSGQWTASILSLTVELTCIALPTPGAVVNMSWWGLQVLGIDGLSYSQLPKNLLPLISRVLVPGENVLIGPSLWAPGLNQTIRKWAGYPRWYSGKEPACQDRRPSFDPWVRKISWRRKWVLILGYIIPTPVFLPGNSHGQRNLVVCSLWVHRESDTTENPHKGASTLNPPVPDICCWRNRCVRVVGGSSPLAPALLPHHLTAALTSQILSVAFGWKSEAASVNSMVCRKFSPPKHFLQWGLPYWLGL